MKIGLSSVEQHTIELQYFLNKPLYTYSMTRVELEKISERILDRIRKCIATAIRQYGSPVDCFILVGNASKMPAVEALSGKVVDAQRLKGFDPGIVVATGTALEGAILAGKLQNRLLVDVVPFSLGIAVLKKGTSQRDLEMSFLIGKNTTIPTQKTETYTTTKYNQTVVEIDIYQGEAPLPQQNFRLGKFLLEGIHPAPAETKKIEVTFYIDANCVLTVTAADKETKNKQSITIKDTFLLSPKEKESLTHSFKIKEHIPILEKDLEAVRTGLGKSILEYNTIIASTERSIQEFFELFGNITKHSRNYRPTVEQTRTIPLF